MAIDQTQHEVRSRYRPKRFEEITEAPMSPAERAWRRRQAERERTSMKIRPDIHAYVVGQGGGPCTTREIIEAFADRYSAQQIYNALSSMVRADSPYPLERKGKGEYSLAAAPAPESPEIPEESSGDSTENPHTSYEPPAAPPDPPEALSAAQALSAVPPAPAIADLERKRAVLERLSLIVDDSISEWLDAIRADLDRVAGER